jgi:hypothetical protein
MFTGRNIAETESLDVTATYGRYITHMGRSGSTWICEITYFQIALLLTRSDYTFMIQLV